MNKNRKNKVNYLQTAAYQPLRTVSVLSPRPIQDLFAPRPDTSAVPAYEEITRRAHEMYVERGCPQDQNEETYRQAEIEKWYKGAAALRRELHG